MTADAFNSRWQSATPVPRLADSLKGRVYGGDKRHTDHSPALIRRHLMPGGLTPHRGGCPAVPGKWNNGSRRSPDCKKARVQCGHIFTGWDCNTTKSHPFPPKRIPRSRRPFSPSHGNRESRGSPSGPAPRILRGRPSGLLAVSDTDICPHLAGTPTF